MRTNDTKERQTFEEFTSQYTPEYLTANYKDVVKEFSTKENAELKRKPKPPLMPFGLPIVSYFPLEQYKAMAQEAINTPLTNREGVINKLLDDYINRPLKQSKSDPSKIYDNIRNQARHTITGNKFLYYTNLIAVEELIKFEMYLLNGCKENAKRAGQKPVEQLSADQYLLVSDNDKQFFLDKLKAGFKDATKKEFCYFLIGLHELNLLSTTNQQNMFYSFSQYFGGDNGSYPNFNKHWLNSNDNKLLDTTKVKIKNIKKVNVIL
ncbi:MAG: hypothetical protein ACTIJ9_10020 [Aequorivita sp.]